MKESAQTIAEKLMKNKQVAEFVRIMKPFELVVALADQGLSPHDASRVAIELVRMSEKTGMGFPDGPNKAHFPPAPRSEPAEWPYDAQTVAAQDPSTRGAKKPLMNSVRMDLDTDNPGLTGRGLPSKSAPHMKLGSDKGWGRSMDDFDLPGEELPVGRPMPVFKGGRNPGPRTGQ